MNECLYRRTILFTDNGNHTYNSDDEHLGSCDVDACEDEIMEDNEPNINLVVRRLVGAQVKEDYDPRKFVPCEMLHKHCNICSLIVDNNSCTTLLSSL